MALTEKLLKIAGKEGYTLDPRISKRYVASLCWKYGFMLIRGWLFSMGHSSIDRTIFVGRGVKALEKRYLSVATKTKIHDKVYIDAPQIEALCEFSKIFGAKAYIGVRFKYTKWLFLEPKNTPRTRNGNYKVEKDYALEKGFEIDEIAGIDKQMKF